MAKKHIFSLSFICLTTLLCAQSIQLSQTQQTITGIYSESELQIGGPVSVGTTSEFLFTNISSQENEYAVVRQAISTISGTSNYFCWDLCFGSDIDSSGILTIAAGDTFNGFSAHYEPDFNPGVSQVSYVFYNINDPADRVVLTVDFVVWGMDINEQSGVEINNIYPTLMSNTLVLETNGVVSERLLLEIFDITGNLIETYKLTENINIVNVRSLKTGIYFARVYDKKELLTTKKIIKK